MCLAPGRSRQMYRDRIGTGRQTPVRIFTENRVRQILAAVGSFHLRVFSDGKTVAGNAVLNLAERFYQVFRLFMRSKLGKSFCSGKFYVDTHAVCQISHPGNQFFRRSGNCFYMNVAIEFVFGPQQIDSLIHLFHRVSGTFHDAGT